MSINDYVAIKKLPGTKGYAFAEKSSGFVVPGLDFIASISPDEPIQYVALLRYTKDELRANHYHKEKTEHLVVLNGIIKVELYLVEDENERLEIEIHDCDVLTIRPGCNHVLIAQTQTAAVLELSPQKLDLSDQFSSDL